MYTFTKTGAAGRFVYNYFTKGLLDFCLANKYNVAVKVLAQTISRKGITR